CLKYDHVETFGVTTGLENAVINAVFVLRESAEIGGGDLVVGRRESRVCGGGRGHLGILREIGILEDQQHACLLEPRGGGVRIGEFLHEKTGGGDLGGESRGRAGGSAVGTRLMLNGLALDLDSDLGGRNRAP